MKRATSFGCTTWLQKWNMFSLSDWVADSLASIRLNDFAVDMSDFNTSDPSRCILDACVNAALEKTDVIAMVMDKFSTTALHVVSISMYYLNPVFKRNWTIIIIYWSLKYSIKRFSGSLSHVRVMISASMYLLYHTAELHARVIFEVDYPGWCGICVKNYTCHFCKEFFALYFSRKYF